jgi:hypothetical protein
MMAAHPISRRHWSLQRAYIYYMLGDRRRDDGYLATIPSVKLGTLFLIIFF